MVKCKRCDIDIIKIKNKKYCDKCSDIIKNEYQKEYKKKKNTNCVKCDIDITDRRAAKYCIECAKTSNMESYEKYKSENDIKEYSKQYYLENKERLKPIRKKWREDNKELEKENNKERYINSDKERLSNYYIENKDEIKKKRDEYKKTDEYKKWYIEYKLKNAYKDRYRYSLKSVIKRLNRDKNDYTSNLLGYSDMDFKIHIENLFTQDMSWEVRDSFEIDHIIPISAFIDNTPLNIVSSLDNLKPMNPSENVIKFTSIDYDYIHIYEKYINYLTDDYKKSVLTYIKEKEV